jgi:3-hydroxyisobutyrate dehydrogenase-like beta-hydroxyacid dehydrogenase
MNIGFIGIGQMGRHMAQHILDAGYDLVVHDLRRETAQHLLEKGAKWMNTPRGVAESCQVVLSSLPGPPEVEEVVYGTNGLMAGWKREDIYVDMSTNSPTTIRRVAEDAKSKGVAVLDAPVSGGTSGAEQGTLTIIVGGDAPSLERIRQVLETMGKNIFHVGDVGCGNIAKLVNNLISTCCNTITAEGLVLGVKAGIDLKKLWEVIKVSTGNNWSLEHGYPRTVFLGNFEPGFRISLALKDISLALALGKEYGVPQLLGAALEQRFVEAKAAGLGDRAIGSIILPLEEVTGVQVRLPER